MRCLVLLSSVGLICHLTVLDDLVLFFLGSAMCNEEHLQRCACNQRMFEHVAVVMTMELSATRLTERCPFPCHHSLRLAVCTLGIRTSRVLTRLIRSSYRAYFPPDRYQPYAAQNAYAHWSSIFGQTGGAMDTSESPSTASWNHVKHETLESKEVGGHHQDHLHEADIKTEAEECEDRSTSQSTVRRPLERQVYDNPNAQ